MMTVDEAAMKLIKVILQLEEEGFEISGWDERIHIDRIVGERREYGYIEPTSRRQREAADALERGTNG